MVHYLGVILILVILAHQFILSHLSLCHHGVPGGQVLEVGLGVRVLGVELGTTLDVVRRLDLAIYLVYNVDMVLVHS